MVDESIIDDSSKKNNNRLNHINEVEEENHD